jgi:hypothetical protein
MRCFYFQYGQIHFFTAKNLTDAVKIKYSLRKKHDNAAMTGVNWFFYKDENDERVYF